MTDNPASPAPDLQSLVDSASRLGIELDEPAMKQWLAALDATPDGDDVSVDVASGTFGYRIAMLDFSPRDLARFRRIGAIVEVKGSDASAESALALSGSAAQSKIQSFPGDCDFFERLNIKAPTREEACAKMAQLMRDHVLGHAQDATYQFLEGKLGTYATDVIHPKGPRSKGSPISWSLDEIRAGEQKVTSAGGDPITLKWNEVALDPGWCKLDWVVVDSERKQLSNASNVIDVTWESPAGDIVSLDGYLDAYFQEVYLDAGELPTFAKVAKFVTDDALDEYVERLEGEVRKYLTEHLNYGKAAKRMYNVFRLSGRHLDAAFVRELFDEPSTILYQVGALIITLDNATQPGSSIPIAAVQAQVDALVTDVVAALDGDQETEIVKALKQLGATLEAQPEGAERIAEVDAAETYVVNLVNTFYRDRLVARPSIKDYIDQIQKAG
jgi:hypothetical protein